MKKFQLSMIAGAVASFTAVNAVALAASAIIEDAKDRCIVGEQADGYLGFVDESAADSALKREVRDVNQQRKSLYADLAAQEGVTIEVTAVLTAEKLINSASSGECVRDANGEWIEL